ncbi:RRM domain-containing protein [Nephila pilipes]|uniref:RRM domain-containing protein n=1 Tax=Nephila pilipes TaxID=299642 RepID=A0A8X6IFJ6_NEPPI|nr:RRM domain-containing protein [Nephila pilipes]
MDDDLLADDGQFKDDGLDELDIDEEAALLGLSDEEIERDEADQELEYVDEDGNPVEIGENNAELYEYANVGPNKRSTSPEDVLELDLDAEIESFAQENADILTRETSGKAFNERQCKENLISLTSRGDREKLPPRRKESLHSPDRSDLSYINHSQSDNFSDAMEYDEESEDESVADDHRERFKSERSNIITLTPAKKRTDIPDTLESVISVEETAKVQAFLENEQKRKMRFKGKSAIRMKNSGRYNRQEQSFSNMQSEHHQPQYSSSNQMQSYQSQPSQSQSRKILINPHFRGVRLPPPVSTEQVMPVNQQQHVSAPPVLYETPQNFAPPVYSHHDNTHQVNINPPVFSAPPPSIPYKPPEYSLPPPPQQHIQQAPPPIWQQPPPEIPPPVSYANPPPSLNYGDPLAQVPGYHNNYNANNFPNPNYSAPQMLPPPQVINYNQPPPIHIHPPSYSPAPATSAQTDVTQMHFQTSQPRQQQQLQNSVQKSYQEQRSVVQSQTSHIQRKNPAQHFARPPDKRVSNSNVKQIPMKQARIDHQTRKNVHINNSNIREIPLVDNLPVIKKSAVKNVPIVEEEDEKTKELRKKIEEQKILREQFLKRKEERRRQMAAQRLMDLKKRQAEQSKNVIAIQRVDQVPTANTAVVQKIPKAKANVRERIGLPMSNSTITGKKKVVVVRKKLVQPANIVPVGEQKKIIPVALRIGNQTTQQPQRIQLQKKAPNNSSVANRNQPIKLKPPATQNKQTIPQQKHTASTDNASAVTNKPIVTKTNMQSNVKQNCQSQHNKKSNVLQRLGNRGNVQKQFHHRNPHPRPNPPSPRFNGPRTPQFQNPGFMEPRMRFPAPGPPMNDMRMPGPPFQEPRPSLLPFRGPGDRTRFNQFMFEPNHPRFRMQGPGFPNFRPMGMDMFPDRFPPPQFPPNQMSPMRQFEPNGQMFQRPRFQGSNVRQKSVANINQQKKMGHVNRNTKCMGKSPSAENVSNENKSSAEKTVISPPKETQKQTKPQNSNQNSENPSHSVLVENLSSSTSEVQLKKLCSSVGVVENIQLIKDERKAIIKFKQPSQALNFQKKYQRYMLDLAMIQVSLLLT